MVSPQSATKTQTATHSLFPIRMRERKEWENLWFEIKTVKWVKQKLCAQAKQNKEFLCYFPRTGKCSAIPRKGSPVTMTWEDKHHHSKHLPLSSSSPIFICWAWHCMVWNTPWVSQGLLSLLCPLPGPRVSPASLLLQPCEDRKGLDTIQALLSSSKSNPVLSTLFSVLIRNLKPSFYEEN